MKKSISNTILAFTLVTLFSSCAFHNGYLSNSTTTVLEKANFSYVQKQIEGRASVKYILGFGGLKKQTIIDHAKRDMLRHHPLDDNQALANVTVNYKTSNYAGIVRKIQCTVTADIVEFN